MRLTAGAQRAQNHQTCRTPDAPNNNTNRTQIDPSLLPPESGAKPNFTQQVVRAIYHKWRAQARRAADYRRLLTLVSFIALLLGVLYAQRGAAVAFRVHSTVAGVVAPPDGAMASQDGVYDWLEGVLKVGCVGAGECWWPRLHVHGV